MSYRTLWDWKKRLGIEHIDGRRGRRQRAAPSVPDSTPDFLPVQIVAKPNRDQQDCLEGSGQGKLELVLPSGLMMRFDQTCSLSLVSGVIMLLERL